MLFSDEEISCALMVDGLLLMMPVHCCAKTAADMMVSRSVKNAFLIVVEL